jgi:hypothetical protein
MLPLCGLRLQLPSGTVGPPEARQWPSSLDLPSRLQEALSANEEPVWTGRLSPGINIGTHQGASIAALNAPGRWKLDPLGLFRFSFFY